MHRFTTTLVLIASAFAAVPALAQTAKLTLTPAAAVWNEPIRARIEGVGCTGATSAPVTSFQAGRWVIDIDLLQCSAIAASAFSTVVELGPLAHEEYTVRVHDAVRHVTSPPPPPLDTELLTVHREASLDVLQPGVATDAAPFTLVFRGSASSPCFSFDDPQVSGNVITATFDGNCPILPPIKPTILDEERQIGPLAAGHYEVRFFDATGWPEMKLFRKDITVYDADGCVPSDTALCLQDARFRLEVAWKDFEGHTGVGHAVPLENGDDSGLFWFFDRANVELTTKVLDGCSYNGHRWVFLSSGSTVEYTVTVTDTATGATKEYENASGQAAPLVADTSAFACAP